MKSTLFCNSVKKGCTSLTSPDLWERVWVQHLSHLQALSQQIPDNFDAMSFREFVFEGGATSRPEYSEQVKISGT